MEIKKGIFVLCVHDLYYGLNNHGPFDSEELAKEFASTQLGFDEIRIKEHEYIKYKENVYLLYDDTKVIKPE
jgi:hypothetical protein